MICLTQSRNYAWQSVVLTKPTVELPVLFSAYRIHGPSASKVNRFDSGAKVFSLHCCTVIFHQLNVFCTSGRVLWPGIVVSPFSLPSHRELKRTERGTCRGYVNCCFFFIYFFLFYIYNVNKGRIHIYIYI